LRGEGWSRGDNLIAPDSLESWKGNARGREKIDSDLYKGSIGKDDRTTLDVCSSKKGKKALIARALEEKRKYNIKGKRSCKITSVSGAGVLLGRVWVVGFLGLGWQKRQKWLQNAVVPLDVTRVGEVGKTTYLGGEPQEKHWGT